MIAGLAHLAATAPVQPERDEARSWAVRELSRRAYQEAEPGLIERALTWLFDRLDRLDPDVGVLPGPALVLVAVIVLAIIGYSVRRSGGLRRSARVRRSAVLPESVATADQHREAAQRHAAAGDWGLAVVERFRAIARELEEGALLGPQPGRTAREVARDGGRARPPLADGLLAAAKTFDDVWYGRVAVGEPAYQALVDLDHQLRTATGTVAR